MMATNRLRNDARANMALSGIATATACSPVTKNTSIRMGEGSNSECNM